MRNMSDYSAELGQVGQSENANAEIITKQQIKDTLNKEFMNGNMTAKDFIDRMLNIASTRSGATKYIEDDAMQALAISLGHTQHSVMMTEANTREILSQGNENERTQSIAKALTPEHLAKMRSLLNRKEENGRDDSPLYAREAYLLSLYHAPGVAGPEDVKELCRELEGEPSTPFSRMITLAGPEQHIYYPQNVYEALITAGSVFDKRPELLDTTAANVFQRLPEILEGGRYFERPSYRDSDFPKEKLVDAAKSLQQTAKKLIPPSSTS
jgi:hypothetical protein